MKSKSRRYNRFQTQKNFYIKKNNQILSSCTEINKVVVYFKEEFWCLKMKLTKITKVAR